MTKPSDILNKGKYDIKNKNGEIVYEKKVTKPDDESTVNTIDYSKMKTPEAKNPVWKDKLKAKLATEEGRKEFAQFKQKLAEQRSTSGKPMGSATPEAPKSPEVAPEPPRPVAPSDTKNIKYRIKALRDKKARKSNPLMKGDTAMDLATSSIKNAFGGQNTPAPSMPSWGDSLSTGISSAIGRAMGKSEDVKATMPAPAEPLDKANDEEESPGLKLLRARLKEKKVLKPGSTDEKIKAALDKQPSARSPGSQSDRSAKIRAALDKQPNNPFSSGVKPGGSFGGSAPALPAQSAAERAKSRWGDGQRSLASVKPIDDATQSPLDKFLARFDDPKVIETTKKLAATGHNEPYFGQDLHGLVYGSAPKEDLPLPIPVFGKVDPAGHLGKEVHSGGPDPLAWLDAKYGVAKQAIQQHRGKPLEISTRSDLVGHDDYMAALDKDHHKINMYVSDLPDRVQRVLEPGAPSNARRLVAAKKLLDAGYNVNIIKQKFPDLHSSVNGIDDKHLEVLKGMPVVNKHVILDPAARAKVKRVLGADWVADQPKTGSQLLQEFAQQDLKGKTEPEKLSPQEKAKLRAKIKKIVKEPPQ